ncbi:unnamed protein product [Prorocentrum cordatum]|uniref:Uncharacterized protein n=1 Tax=Prorocentrum cordatum TaxID=2364126 RepID=A0ABN9QUB0_9DINO|nr:unnamed protein product [Polarella glacialis]
MLGQGQEACRPQRARGGFREAGWPGTGLDASMQGPPPMSGGEEACLPPPRAGPTGLCSIPHVLIHQYKLEELRACLECAPGPPGGGTSRADPGTIRTPGRVGQRRCSFFITPLSACGAVAAMLVARDARRGFRRA